MAASRITRLVAGAALPALLLATGPTPAQALRTLETAQQASDAVAPLVALLTVVAWCLLGWLALVAVGVWTAGRGGRPAGAAAAVVGRIAPAGVRRLVALSLGLSVAAAVATASPALADTDSHAPGPRLPVASLDWPTATAAPDLDWNPAAAGPTAPGPSPRPERATTHAAAVVVRPGDSLWAVAAQHLPPDATAAAIAQTWPTWWWANRAAIGADPGLIHPGLLLTPPDHS
jgi:hypothetical protein